MCIKIFKLFTLLILPAYWSLAVADNGVIAYVGSSLNNEEIHIINPDGSEDKLLWRVPSGTTATDGIGSLSWHPEGATLAFDSGHNWHRSTAIRDLYAISPNGTGYHQVTDYPGVDGSNNYPTGTVKFTVGAREQGDVQIYIEGMKEPHKYFARQSMDYTITATVADWGEGVRQYIRLFDPGQLDGACRFSQEGWVDVIPGQEVDLGRVPLR